MIGLARRAIATGNGLVLALHRVLPTDEQNLCYNPHLTLNEAAFVSLLQLLRQEYEVVHLQDLLDNPAGSSGHPKVAITLDDGWEDNYRVAFPHLLAHQMPATIFACTGFSIPRNCCPKSGLPACGPSAPHTPHWRSWSSTYVIGAWARIKTAAPNSATVLVT